MFMLGLTILSKFSSPSGVAIDNSDFKKTDNKERIKAITLIAQYIYRKLN